MTHLRQAQADPKIMVSFKLLKVQFNVAENYLPNPTYLI
jgi:hypothetical protein